MDDSFMLYICGLILMGIGLWLLLSELLRKERCTQPVSAVVTDFISTKNRRGFKYYTPVFTYSFEGTEHTAKLYFCTRSGQFRIRQEVEIFVDPNAPDKIYLPDSYTIWIGSTACIAFGALILCVAKGE